MESIFDKLDKLVNKSKSLTESMGRPRRDDREEDFKTREQGEQAAIQQIASRILDDGPTPPPPPGGGGPTPPEEDDDPFRKHGKKGGGGESGGDDKTFRSHKFDDFDDGLDELDDVKSGDDDTDGGDTDDLKDDDFEFDDFDYEDKDTSSSSGDDSGDDGEDGEDGGETGSSFGGDPDDEDDDIGDEDDYDFGDDEDGDTDEDGGTSGKSKSGGSESGEDDEGEEGESGEDGGEEGGTPSDKKGKGKSDRKGRKEDSHDKESGGKKEDTGAGGTGDIDYDDTLDYDTDDDDSLESGVKDALERAKEEATDSEKKTLDDIKDSFEDEDGKSSAEKGDKLKSDIDKATDESKSSGKGELAGESLDAVPTDKEFEEEMKKAGFSDKDIENMKKSKNKDTSDKIDEDKVAREAVAEMDKKVKNGDGVSSSLSQSIMRAVLDHKVTNMEWKEMVRIFLDQKSKNIGTLGKTTSTGWGHKNHLWREVMMPKTVETSGSAGVIYCFIDFSGSVSEPLVKIFLRKVLSMCDKLVFDVVKVYGFGERLSQPYELKKKDIGTSEHETEKSINKMWSFIREQNLGGRIENFEAVSIEIDKIKRKESKAPIMIFGDGLWALSYPNPKPPKYLQINCPRCLKDILVLVYYYDDPDYIRCELGYLKHVVGIEHIVTTQVDELK